MRPIAATLCMAACLLTVLRCLGAAETAEFPYLPTNYEEPYRGQYHFSAQNGWMNDINGLWYYKGEYHMTFQHFPYGLAWNNMHWGHAVSADMLHWVQKPIALKPGDNVPGQCFSGSVVVDSANTSGLKTGPEDVFVAIYTATKKGTCLAYSNDRGRPGRLIPTIPSPSEQPTRRRAIRMCSGTGPRADGWRRSSRPARGWCSITLPT